MRDSRLMAKIRGFTLIEIVVVLAIAAVLAALLIPAAFQSLQSSKEATTRAQVERIYKAIMGDPSKGNYGYLGDMGRFPATLSELVTQGSQQGYHTSHTEHIVPGTGAHVALVGTGWRGPYLTGTDASDDLFKDAWGVALSYTNTGTNAGQVVSGGPDGQISTAGDNITYPVQVPIQTKGYLIITVVVNDIPQPTGLTVKVYSTIDGNQGAAVVQTPSGTDGKPFRFEVPHGPSAIETIHTQSGVTVTRITTIDVAAGTQVSRVILMKTSATVAM